MPDANNKNEMCREISDILKRVGDEEITHENIMEASLLVDANDKSPAILFKIITRIEATEKSAPNTQRWLLAIEQLSPTDIIKVSRDGIFVGALFGTLEKSKIQPSSREQQEGISETHMFVIETAKEILCRSWGHSCQKFMDEINSKPGKLSTRDFMAVMGLSHLWRAISNDNEKVPPLAICVSETIENAVVWAVDIDQGAWEMRAYLQHERLLNLNPTLGNQTQAMKM